MSILNPQ